MIHSKQHYKNFMMLVYSTIVVIKKKSSWILIPLQDEEEKRKKRINNVVVSTDFRKNPILKFKKLRLQRGKEVLIKIGLILIYT